MATSLQVGDIVNVKATKKYPKAYVGLVAEIRQLGETVALIKSIKMFDKDIPCLFYNFEDLEVIGYINLDKI